MTASTMSPFLTNLGGFAEGSLVFLSMLRSSLCKVEQQECEKKGTQKKEGKRMTYADGNLLVGRMDVQDGGVASTHNSLVGKEIDDSKLRNKLGDNRNEIGSATDHESLRDVTWADVLQADVYVLSCSGTFDHKSVKLDKEDFTGLTVGHHGDSVSNTKCSGLDFSEHDGASTISITIENRNTERA